MATILCVDDEAAVGVVLEHVLQKLSHETVLASSVEEAMKVVRRMQIDLIISDYQMPGQTGIDLLNCLKKDNFDIPVVMMTGHSNIANAVLSIRSGAVDYLPKPIRAETLEVAVNHALEVTRLKSENERYRQELSSIQSRRIIVGESDALRKVLEVVATVAPTKATVLLEGESGTGKELFARAIHDQSPRHDKPFITLNCAAMPEGLVESELFGHERGAFTGASNRKHGAFERAHNGTLLLDEISEMRLDLQSKLLRVVQEGEFERVGGQQLIKVDVRLIATTNRDLQKEVTEGRFREDLFYRLNVVPIKPPPLRDRLEDISLLVNHFIHKCSKEHNVPASPVEPETIEYLQSLAWPGNVRELANAVERAVVLSGGKPLTPQMFKGNIGIGGKAAQAKAGIGANGTGGENPWNTLNLAAVERLVVRAALKRTNNNRTKAAKLLGIADRTLRNMLNVRRILDDDDDNQGAAPPEGDSSSEDE